MGWSIQRVLSIVSYGDDSIVPMGVHPARWAAMVCSAKSYAKRGAWGSLP